MYNSKLRQQFTIRVLGRSPRRRGSGKRHRRLERREGRRSPSILLITYRFPGVDPILGPEMRSTGEVLGLAENFPLAFYKSQVGSGTACGAKTVQWTVFSESPSSYAAKACRNYLTRRFRGLRIAISC